MNPEGKFQLEKSILKVPKRDSDPRLAHLLNPEGAQILIGGWPDDEGVSNNGGRPGASEGPNAILKSFLKMTPPAFSKKSLPEVNVLGSHLNGEMNLFERLESGKQITKSALSNGKTWIGLGGGHDYGYADGAGFLETFGDQNPLVINFDAHLDVRPFDKNKITSGTPFSRLLTDYSGKFEFVEVGVQEYCNSKEHADWVLSKNGKIISLNDIRSSTSPVAALEAVLSKNSSRPCYLSVDIDAFSSSFAMGCSQAWPTGLTPVEF